MFHSQNKAETKWPMIMRHVIREDTQSGNHSSFQSNNQSPRGACSTNFDSCSNVPGINWTTLKEGIRGLSNWNKDQGSFEQRMGRLHLESVWITLACTLQVFNSVGFGPRGPFLNSTLQSSFSQGVCDYCASPSLGLDCSRFRIWMPP